MTLSIPQYPLTPPLSIPPQVPTPMVRLCPLLFKIAIDQSLPDGWEYAVRSQDNCSAESRQIGIHIQSKQMMMQT